MPTTNTYPSQAPTPRTPRRWALLTSILCLAALPLAAGCGESNATQAAATTTPPTNNTTTTTPTTTTTTSQATSAKPPAPATAHPPAAAAKGRVRKAFSSLANAKPAPKLPAAQRANLAVDDIELTSPAIHAHNGTPATIARENTCDGANQTPALNWKNIPPGTAELAIFIISTTPVNNKLFYDWAITGINPHLHGIPAGQTPPQTITGRNSYGNTNYSICPPPGKNETYLIALYALPHKLNTTPGYEPNQLRKQTLHTAHHSGLLVGSYQHT